MMNASNLGMIDVYNFTVPASLAGTTLWFYCAAPTHCVAGSVTNSSAQSEMRGAIAINGAAVSTTAPTSAPTTASTTKAGATTKAAGASLQMTFAAFTACILALLF
jgi:hypothetical protein